MSLIEKQKTFSLNVAKLIDHIYSSGFACSMGEAWRTQEQAEIYAKTGAGILDSLHCKRLAIDLNIFGKDGKLLATPDDYRPFGEFWNTLHGFNRWGGCFKRVDSDHFEMQDL